MNHILIPTDFSTSSLHAITYALDFFRGETCSFHLLHVQKTSEYQTGNLMSSDASASIQDSIIQEDSDKLTSLIHTLSAKYPHQSYHFIPEIEYDPFTDAINQIIIAKNIDLIVMGTNGVSGFKEVIFGSNTVNVIRNTSCPVLIVPKGYIFESIQNVLYTVDNSNNCPTHLLSPLKTILQNHAAHLKILNIKNEEHIKNEETNTKKQLESFFSNIPQSYHPIVNVSTKEAINSFIQIMNIDLNAMFIKKETLIERYITGSKNINISYKTIVPLLVIHEDIQ
ncbi:universal stress protein [Aquimarina hainanensis]|uniref:Universal stress protein n=1 Tax=Aquimarina hainanensis TaxID=1578017 RepID=A0ABW5N5N3_9FLAO|nr:universal stress protein [Aquimarina sp. TRL1]QKX04383.1 universal stress protein [Aquimarina sp. TRL1]